MGKHHKTVPCPCGLGEFDQCCGPFISHQALPETPEQLMRSRYTAFVLKDADYLQYTWHPDYFPATPLFDHNESIKWLRLVVIKSQITDATHGIVEFSAHYKIQGRAEKLHEISRFTQIPAADGQLHWVYVSGDIQD